MKYIIWMLLLSVSITACNNEHKDHSTGKETPKSKADSLMAAIMDGHDVGMAKYGKLRSMRKRIQEAIDSLGNKSSDFRQGLTNTAKELDDAIAGMDKWMEEFNMDSAVNNMEQRINYLMNEKLKVGKVKESILKSLQDADSVLKARF